MSTYTLTITPHTLLHTTLQPPHTPQGSSDSTGGVLSTLKHMVTEPLHSDGSGSVMTLFNYGLLTAVHVVPGFVSFVAMR